MGHPFEKLLTDPDDWVIGPRFSTACYVEHSVPAVLYLSLKYHNDPEKVAPRAGAWIETGNSRNCDNLSRIAPEQG